jgi:uncharacterized protein
VVARCVTVLAQTLAAEARAVQLRFFERYLRDRDVPAPPRIRLEVRESRNVITTVRDEAAWPLDRTQWRPLYLTAAGLAAEPPPAAGHLTFDLWAQGARWEWTAGADTEITGPMGLRLFVEAHDADDIDLFVGVEKWRGQRYVPFEGSYGFGRDRITTGWLKASLRRLDEPGSRPFDPVPTFGQREPLRPGQVVQAARQPAHRAVPGRLPKGPERQMHRALGTGTPGPPARPRNRQDRCLKTPQHRVR